MEQKGTRDEKRRMHSAEWIGDKGRDERRAVGKGGGVDEAE
jgi:hypothetical protein